MSNWLASIVKDLEVTETNNRIDVTGMRSAKYFLFEVGNVLKTTRFTSGMIRNIKSSSFSISRFFIYDFYELIKKVRTMSGLRYRTDIIDKLIYELEKLECLARINRVYPTKLDPSQLKRFTFEPMKHQTEFFEHYDQKTQQYDLNGYILASAPGTGKTIMSLMLMAMLNKEIVIVFSPNNALNQVWKKTLDSVKGAKTWVYPEPLNPRESYTHFVFSHENTKYAKEIIPVIMRYHRGLNVGIILDECHRFTELVANQTNNIIHICQYLESNDIVFMSGTPFKAMGKELLPFLMATDPFFTKHDIEGFRKIFGASGNSAREILAARIGRTMYRVETEDVFKNDITNYVVKVKTPDGDRYTLPEIRKKMVEFIVNRRDYYNEHGPAMIAKYHRILGDFKKSIRDKKELAEFDLYVKYAKLVRDSGNIADCREEIVFCNKYERNVIIPKLSPGDKIIFKNVKSVYKYVQLKIQGEALGQVLVAERAMCNVSIMRHINNGVVYKEDSYSSGNEWTLDDIFVTSKSKVVMFTDFVEVVKEANLVLRNHGYEPALVYGDTNKDLNSIIKRAENDPNIDPIVATYRSLSTAVPLIFASTVVLLNLPFRDYVYQQTIARVNRLGQNHPVTVYQYQLDTGDMPNISTRSKDIMEWSKQMVKELMGLDSDDLVEDAEDFDDYASQFIEKDNRAIFSKW